MPRTKNEADRLLSDFIAKETAEISEVEGPVRLHQALIDADRLIQAQLQESPGPGQTMAMLCLALGIVMEAGEFEGATVDMGAAMTELVAMGRKYAVLVKASIEATEKVKY